MKHPVGDGASRSSCFILVSGNKSFAAARAAGADMIEADNKCPGDTVYIMTVISISSCQRNLMKTYHNEANTSGITKIASKKFLECFEQSS